MQEYEPLPMENIVYLNGKFLPAREAGVPVFTPGFLNGIGCFETMRSYGKRIVYLDEHIKRLRESAHFIGINTSKLRILGRSLLSIDTESGVFFPRPLGRGLNAAECIKFTLSSGRIKKIIDKLVSQNKLSDAYVRITVWKQNNGADILIFAKEYKPYPEKAYSEGFRLNISGLRQNEESVLCRHKTINRLLYEMSFQQAKQKGFDEALMLNNRGHIAETSRSNIFFVKNKEIFTPSLECGCLNGITRKIIFKFARNNNVKLYEGKFTVCELIDSDEAFLTNSLMGIMPVKALENYPIGKSNRKNFSKIFMKRYDSLLRDGN